MRRQLEYQYSSIPTEDTNFCGKISNMTRSLLRFIAYSYDLAHFLIGWILLSNCKPNRHLSASSLIIVYACKSAPLK